MSGRGTRAAWRLGARRLVALTCFGCGRLLPGEQFDRRPMRTGIYIDRRCRERCRWRGMEANPGR